MTDTITTLDRDTPKIPDSPQADDSFAPITEIASANSTTSLAKLGDRYLQWLDHKTMLTAALKDANEIIGRLERVVADRMIEEEFPRLPRGNKTIHLRTKTFASARAGKMPEIVAWAHANGHAANLEEKPNTDALAAAAALAAGDIGSEDNPHLDEPLTMHVFPAKKLAAMVKDLDETKQLPADLADLVNIERDRGLGVRTDPKTATK